MDSELITNSNCNARPEISIVPLIRVLDFGIIVYLELRYWIGDDKRSIQDVRRIDTFVALQRMDRFPFLVVFCRVGDLA